MNQQEVKEMTYQQLWCCICYIGLIKSTEEAEAEFSTYWQNEDPDREIDIEEARENWLKINAAIINYAAMMTGQA
jgi:hypothetical protein